MKCRSDYCRLKDHTLTTTGFNKPHPILYCPICKEAYWFIEKGITNAWTGKLEEYESHFQKYPEGIEVEKDRDELLKKWYEKHKYYWRYK